MLAGLLLPHVHLLRHVAGVRHTPALRNAWRYLGACVPLSTRPALPAASASSNRYHRIILLGGRDHHGLARRCRDLLTLFGYQLLTSWDPLEAAALSRKITPALIIVLEPEQPDMLIKLRAALAQHDNNGGGPPLLVLGPEHDPIREINALVEGADDYLPFTTSGERLHARLLALQRRSDQRQPGAATRDSVVVLDQSGHRSWIGGTEVELPPRLFRLLTTFTGNPDKVLSSARLIELVWDDAPGVRVATVKTHVCQLRKFFAAHDLPDVIVTIPRIGYRYEVPAPRTALKH